MSSTAYPTWLYWFKLPSYRGLPKEIQRFSFFQSFLAHNLIEHRVMVVLHYPKGNFGETHYYALYSLPNLAVLVNTVSNLRKFGVSFFSNLFLLRTKYNVGLWLYYTILKGNFGGTHYYALYILPNLAVLVNTVSNLRKFSVSFFSNLFLLRTFFVFSNLFLLRT